MHGADEPTNQRSSCRRGWHLCSAAHHKVAGHLRVPACFAPLGICHACSLPLIQTQNRHFTSTSFFPSTFFFFSFLSQFERSSRSRCVSTRLKDAGLYGDDHYVPAIGQTEASSGSTAATASAAAHRWTGTNYLSWCEWIDSFTHASPWEVVSSTLNLLQSLANHVINPKTIFSVLSYSLWKMKLQRVKE